MMVASVGSTFRRWERAGRWGEGGMTKDRRRCRTVYSVRTKYGDWHAGPTNAWLALDRKCSDGRVPIERSAAHSWGCSRGSEYVGGTQYKVRQCLHFRSHFATFLKSSTNARSASARTSLGARSTELGCTVAKPASARSVRITLPCCVVTRIVGPKSALAAVAPSATMTRGFTTAISSSSQGWQARTSDD